MLGKKKEFNLVLTGVGGQGIITLLRIIGEAALAQGYDVRTSELHGLSQKGGTVQAHARFGKKVLSPLVQKGRADLILGLEMIEAFRAMEFANKDAMFLVNKKYIGFKDAPEKDEVFQQLNSTFEKINWIEAGDICAKKLGKEVLAGTYLLSLGILQGIIPLDQKSLFIGFKKALKPKYLDLNKKAFELAHKDWCETCHITQYSVENDKSHTPL